MVDGIRLSAADLVAGARTAAAGLRARGVRGGDGIALVDDGGGAELLTVLIGTWWIGARATVVSGSASRTEMNSVVRQGGVTFVVRSEPPPTGEGGTFAALLAGGADTIGVETCVPGDIALDIASSGTTGDPKCVSFTHGALSSNVRAIANRLELTKGDVLYSPLSLSLAGVLGMVVLPGLLADAVVHVGRLSGPRIASARKQIEVTRPTLIYGVPYMYEVLARSAGPVDHSTLRWAICSSAPLPRATFDRVRARLGVPPRSSYCLAEAGTVTLNTDDDPDALRTTVGQPLDGVEITVEPLGPDRREGRLSVGGAGCAAGYRRMGELEPFPGRIRTSDLGFLRNGRLTISGRLDEVMQVAGQNVDLAQVRDIISRCPGLGDFALVAGRHERLGLVPVLLAEARTLTASPQEVIAFCRSALRDAEVPREVRVVEEIPRTATGKVRLSTGEAE
ncbi:class I adenylate-forming enzyme family protein [Streptomyces sp. NPDC004752]